MNSLSGGPRILVLGSSGLLGQSLIRHAPEGVRCLAPEQDDLPLEDQPGLDRFLRREGVDRIICLAAWTNVDGCEDDPDRAFRVNGILPGRLALMAERLGIPFLFMSTDYVFDGEARVPYREYDEARPLSVYGRSKWHGECAVRSAAPRACIVRSAGLYGEGGPGFVSAILNRLQAGPVEVVTDEVNTPTYAEDLAPAVWHVALADLPGTWHLTNSGKVSRFEFARRIAELSGHEVDLVRPTTHARLGRPARRPAYSVLACQAVREILGLELPSWEDALSRHMAAAASGARPKPGGPTL
jgi:dTDP-4-dehydrorhamnose reductase